MDRQTAERAAHVACCDRGLTEDFRENLHFFYIYSKDILTLTLFKTYSVFYYGKGKNVTVNV